MIKGKRRPVFIVALLLLAFCALAVVKLHDEFPQTFQAVGRGFVKALMLGLLAAVAAGWIVSGLGAASIVVVLASVAAFVASGAYTAAAGPLGLPSLPGGRKDYTGEIQVFE